MKVLPVLVLLALVVQLCSAAPAVQPVTCSVEDGGAVAARLAMHHINEHHHHGYKFRLDVIDSNKVDQYDGGCDIELQLKLKETICHTVNPKHFEDCELREDFYTVLANCTVMMSVKDGDAQVTKYECLTKRDVESRKMCPDCPVLLSLDNADGFKSVSGAVSKFRENSTNQHIYVLLEVGRVASGYIPGSGMYYATESILVETQCPFGSRINLAACKPLCHGRAGHALCKSTYYQNRGLGDSVECEFYPPENTTALGPGEQEPVCRHPPHAGGPPPHAGGRGPPPHAGDGGPPPHAGDGGPPPHAGGRGPPPHAGGRGPPPHAGGGGPPPHAGGGRPPPHGGPSPPQAGGPLHSSANPCHGALTEVDPAVHPICPWPVERSKGRQL